jgi:hypothetical protein
MGGAQPDLISLFGKEAVDSLLAEFRALALKSEPSTAAGASAVAGPLRTSSNKTSRSTHQQTSAATETSPATDSGEEQEKDESA